MSNFFWQLNNVRNIQWNQTVAAKSDQNSKPLAVITAPSLTKSCCQIPLLSKNEKKKNATHQVDYGG